MEELDIKIKENIEKAQSYKDIPISCPFVPYSSFADLLEKRAELYKDKIHLIFYDEKDKEKQSFSYGLFNREINKVANFLKEGLDIKRGDRIATLMYNHWVAVLIYYSVLKIGAVIVPINAGEGNERVKFILDNSNAKVLFVKEEFLERVVPMIDDLRDLKDMVVVSNYEGRGDHGLHLYTFEEILQQGNPGFSLDRGDMLDEEALIVYTSGTTGLPKGVVLTQYNLLADAHGIAKALSLQECDRFMCILPIHHVNGFVVTLLTPLLLGASVVLNRRFGTGYFWKRIHEDKVSVVSLVPTILKFLLEADEDISKWDLSHFRRLICGAGPLTVELAMRFEQRFGIPITHGYGLSETTCYSCFLPSDLTEEEHRHWMMDFGFPSIGIAFEPNEMAIHDEKGRKLPKAQRGEIVIRGHNVMKGYFRRPEANQETFEYQWFRSGDEGFFEMDGKGREFFFITGRIKELIIRGGINISPFEIDEVLQGIKGVKGGLAVGFENDWYGEEVGAYVQPEEGANLTEEEIKRICAQKLPFIKTPKVVIFGNEIPVTSTGKYQRNKLKHFFDKYKHVQFRE